MATISSSTLITTKILIGGCVRRFKIPIKDLGANTFPGVLKDLLSIPAEQEVIFERYSDSAGQYVVLDSNKPAVYKQLYRAAKAKLKLKIKVTVLHQAREQETAESSEQRAPTGITPPAYASQVTLPLYAPPEQIVPEAAPVPAPNAEHDPEPLEKVVSSAVAGYFESEECKTKIRAIVDEGIERGFEKRTASLNLSSSTSESKPTTDESQYKPFPFLGRQIYAVYCNCCEANVEDVHYHCGICDNGDFDLCQNCKDAGKHCENNDHWLIKRTISNGEIVSSTTESIRVPNKAFNLEKEEAVKPVPKPVPVEEEIDRYCNGCCETFAESEFVQCTTCPDFDLCIACHIKAEHGHHPGHAFKPATNNVPLNSLATSLLAPGRNLPHPAICDGCEKQIYGVRHKCLNCPDWDFCSDCMSTADIFHRHHRFVPVYEALKPLQAHPQCHIGIYCDGPLCKTRRCISGDRYKCAICPDFDLCASCEASPLNKHNPTHPLIKLKTPVRGLTIQTCDADATGISLGDRIQPRSTTPSTTSSQVQTVVDIEPATNPTEPATEVPVPEKPESLSEKIELEVLEVKPTETKAPVEEELKAIFIKDTIRDGTPMEAGTKFTQIWTLFNSGNQSWPVGVSLTFTGGDSFCDSEPARANTTVTSEETSAGRCVEFSVDLVAPAAIRQHIGYWRLVTADGIRFGPSLWCAIQVAEPKPVVPPATPVEVVEAIEAVEVEEECSDKAKIEANSGTKSLVTMLEEEDLLVSSQTSHMIFPTLEKESPVPSISNSITSAKPVEEEQSHQPSSPSTVAGLPPSSPSTISGAGDDVASDTVSFIDDDIEEEHFLSDDEDYDVLAASDDDDFRDA